MTDRFGIEPFRGVGGNNHGRLAPGLTAKNQSLDVAAGERAGSVVGGGRHELGLEAGDQVIDQRVVDILVGDDAEQGAADASAERRYR